MPQSVLQIPQNARGQYIIFAGQASDFAHAVFVSPMQGEVRIAGAELRVQHNSLFVTFRTTGWQIHSRALCNSCKLECRHLEETLVWLLHSCEVAEYSPNQGGGIGETARYHGGHPTRHCEPLRTARIS